MSVFTGHMDCIGKNNKLNALRKRCMFAILFDAIHMAREHRQNVIQYLYLHLFTTNFVALLLTLAQKCHISQISNVQKSTNTWNSQQTDDDWTNTNKWLIFLKFDYRKCSNILKSFFTINMSFTFEMDIGKGIGGAVLIYIALKPRSHECTRASNTFNRENTGQM